MLRRICYNMILKEEGNVGEVSTYGNYYDGCYILKIELSPYKKQDKKIIYERVVSSREIFVNYC